MIKSDTIFLLELKKKDTPEKEKLMAKLVVEITGLDYNDIRKQANLFIKQFNKDHKYLKISRMSEEEWYKGIFKI